MILMRSNADAIPLVSKDSGPPQRRPIRMRERSSCNRLESAKIGTPFEPIVLSTSVNSTAWSSITIATFGITLHTARWMISLGKGIGSKLIFDHQACLAVCDNYLAQTNPKPASMVSRASSRHSSVSSR